MSAPVRSTRLPLDLLRRRPAAVATGRRVPERAEGQGTLRWTGLPRMLTSQVVMSVAVLDPVML